MTTVKTYEIRPGDCLDLISEKFDISKSVLQELNSDQIKDIDLIYAGNTLKLSGNEGSPIEVDLGTRTTLPLVPEKPACGNELCSSQVPDFVDILYVPAHPETGEKTWYALTKTAQEAVMSEIDLFKSAVTTDRQTTFNNLNTLGILSKFEHKPHEMFLSDTDIERLRTVSWMLVTIQSGAAKNYFNGGENGFIISIAEQEDGIDYYSILSDSLTWEKLKDFVFKVSIRTAPISYYIGKSLGFIDEVDEENKEYILREKALSAAKLKVVDYLEDEIALLEKKAVKAAGKVVTDDGTNFVYSEKESYFTSEKQDDIAKCIKKVNSYRRWSDEELSEQNHEELNSKLDRFWNQDVKNSAQFINALEEFKRGSDIPSNAMSAYSFTFYLLKLNDYGFVVKEQCLPKELLIGTDKVHLGPESLYNSSKYKNWRDDASLTIEPDDYNKVVSGLLTELLTFDDTVRDDKHIRAILSSNKCSASQWAYYPTLALIRFIDATLSEWLSSIRSIMGGRSIPDMFSDLIWVKKVALERLEQLKRRAEASALQGKVINFYLNKDKLSAMTLLWDEKNYKVLEKKIGIFSNKAGDADLQAVECSLLSNEGEVGWVRGPSWFLPTAKKNLSKGHCKDITEKVVMVDPLVNADAAGKTLSEALDEIKKQLAGTFTKANFVTGPLNLNKTIEKYDSSAFWQSHYHWQGGRADNGSSAYIANAQAQFLRLSSSASGSLNLPLSELDALRPNLDLTTGASIQANFTLLSGQIGFSSWFPTNDKDQNVRPDKGHGLSISYVALDYESMTDKKREYDAGECFVKLSAKVYGLAAASCQLSGNLSFGPSETNGGLGVKGKSIKVLDANQASENLPKARVLKDGDALIPQAAAQTGVKVDVFAGVEAGGSIDAEVHWKPPAVMINNNKVEQSLGKLGSISAQMAANYGIGYSGEFRFTFQNGQIVLITSAKAVCGPGFSGKFSVTLSPVMMDRFLACLLGVLKESGFRYVEVFGDYDKNGRNEYFEQLNERLTIAMALGLTFGDVMLLPSVVYDEYKNDVLQEDYAPMIARHITMAEVSSSKKDWIRNLPPETLAKLLNCLTNKKEESFFESDLQKISRQENEERKVSAVIQILKWISPTGNDENKFRTRQFEETLIRIGGNLEDVRTPASQWQRFADSWRRLEEYIISVSDNNRGLRISFNDNVWQLAINMHGYRYKDVKGNFHYRAYRVELDDETQKMKLDREKIKAVFGSDPRWEFFSIWKI